MQLQNLTVPYQYCSQALLMSSNNVTSAVIEENGRFC